MSHMLLVWRKPSLFRESLGALLCALVLLAGVVQARAGTELAAKSGFVSALVLCQQKALAGDGPDPDSNCDHCRIPAPLAFGAPCLVINSGLRLAHVEKAAAPTHDLIADIRTILPEARGPPSRA